MARPRYYRLAGKNTAPCTLDEWVECQTRGEAVGSDRIGEALISTLFLGVDQQNRPGPPLLFESTVYGGPADGELMRCATYAEAEKMHQKMLHRVQTMTQEAARAIARARRASSPRPRDNELRE